MTVEVGIFNIGPAQRKMQTCRNSQSTFVQTTYHDFYFPGFCHRIDVFGFLNTTHFHQFDIDHVDDAVLSMVEKGIHVSDDDDDDEDYSNSDEGNQATSSATVDCGSGRTKFCRYYKRGKCNFGDKCRYTH